LERSVFDYVHFTCYKDDDVTYKDDDVTYKDDDVTYKDDDVTYKDLGAFCIRLCAFHMLRVLSYPLCDLLYTYTYYVTYYIPTMCDLLNTYYV